MWASLIQSVEDFKRKRQRFLEEEGIMPEFSVFRLKTAILTLT